MPFDLPSGAHLCYFAAFDGLAKPPNFMSALLILSPSSTGSVEAFGLLSGPGSEEGAPPAPHYPRGPAATVWDAAAAVGHLWADEGAVGLPGALSGPLSGNKGAYVCLASVGAEGAQGALRAAASPCPLTLHANGFVSLCSSTPEDVRYTSDDCPAAVCECTGVYTRPAAPVMPGLGFEACASPVVPLGDDATVVVAAQAHMPGTWHYWNFTVGGGTRFVWVGVAATANTSSRVAAFLQRAQPPGRNSNQAAVRSEMADFAGDLSLSLSVGAPWDPVFAPGVWYVGVWVWGAEPASYTLTLRRGGCPGMATDCSGHGVCGENGECTCEEVHTGRDCSTSTTTLTLGAPVTVDARAGFRADLFELPNAAAAAPIPTLALRVRASFSAKDPLPDWISARPTVLVSGTSPSPTLDSAPLRLKLGEVGQEGAITLSGEQLPSGSLYLTFYNPLDQPYQIGYTLTLDTVPHCLDGCSGHGTCGGDGRCTCEAPWGGATCSIDTTPGPGPTPAAGCLEGSLRKEDAKVQGGSVYSVCVCTPATQDPEQPAECGFTTPAVDKGKVVDSRSGVVVCGAGYQAADVKEGGITLSDGTAVASGGRCAAVKNTRKGTSGGMVFFWCLFSVSLAFGLVKAYQWGEARQWHFGGDGSGDGYVPLAGWWEAVASRLPGRNRGDSNARTMTASRDYGSAW